MDEESYKQHRIASDASPLLAMVSVSAMSLPSSVELSGKVISLGARVAKQAQRTHDSLAERHGENLPFLIALAVKTSWHACWSGAHYFRLLQLPVKVPPGEDGRYAWQAEGYGDFEGWANALYNSLNDAAISSQQALLADMPFTSLPDQSSMLSAISLYWLHHADELAKLGDVTGSYNWLHEAYDALILENGGHMWDAGAEHGKEVSAEEAGAAARKALAKSAATARHRESRSMKQAVFSWCDENMSRFGSMDDAALDIAETFVPQKFRTVRDWMTEWRKLNSSSNPSANS